LILLAFFQRTAFPLDEEGLLLDSLVALFLLWKKVAAIQFGFHILIALTLLSFPPSDRFSFLE